MTTKRALCVGINAYHSAPLQGCVNDAQDWAAVLKERGYYVGILLDENATKQTILEALEARVAASRFGDRIVFTYSGHGSWIPDQDGDESDGRDEVLCAIDYQEGGLITDDELAAIFAKRRFGVRVTVVSDSCHSGSVNRFARLQPLISHPVQEPRPRFVHPATFVPDNLQRAVFKADQRRAVTTPRKLTGTVLFSGCADEEVSYDAWIDGRPRGAFTAAALRTEGANIPYSLWHRMTRDLLPSEQYPQSPQLYASLWQRRWSL